MALDPVPVSRSALEQHRLERVRRALSGSGTDVLIVSSPENVLYTTGYQSVPAELNRRYAMGALITAERVMLVVPAADTAAAIAEGIPPSEIVPFGRFYFSGRAESASMSDRHASIEEAMSVALARLPGNRVRLESHGLPSTVRDLIAARYEHVLGATKWMLRVRSRKLPEEVALLRRASELAERGIEAGLAVAEVGVTDKEVAAQVASTMALGGGMPRNVTVVGGERSALSDVISTERPLCAGDLLRFDVGCDYYGYKSDMARTAVLGEPTRLQSERYLALLAGLEAEMAIASAGTEAGKLFAVAVSTVELAGLVPYRRHHTGHAIGLSSYEHPVISADDRTQLQLDETFSLETPYYEPGWGGMMVEETGVVTEKGFDLFTTIDRSLRVIPV